MKNYIALFICSFIAYLCAYVIASWHVRDLWKEIRGAKKRLDALEKK